MATFPMKAALLSGVSLLAATAALAQDDEVFELPPIEIFGDRSADTIDQTQSSVAVIPEDRVNGPTSQSVTDTFRQTVNVTDGDFTESGFVLRGVNSEGLTPGGAGAPLASIYIDGVQQTAEAARRGLRGTFDAEQVEIYRGPQSTLTGRNALAGAIYIRTKDPEFESSGEAQLTYGSDNKKQVGLAYGGAITDNLAFRLSGEWSTKDSDLNYPSYTDYPNFDDFTEDEYYTLRGKLLWLPFHSEGTEVLFSYSRSFDSPTSNTIAGPLQNAASGVTYDDLRGDIYGALTPASFGVTPLPIFQDVRETTTDNFGIEVTHELSNTLTLTALTSYSDSETDRRSINYGLEVADVLDSTAWNVIGGFDQRIFSQEVRLNYEREGLRWVGGLYVADETNEAFRDQFAVNDTFTSVETTSTTNKSDISNYALFGEVTYEFAPQWEVILGGRLDYYKQEQYATATVEDLFFGPLSDTESFSDHSETAFIPKVGLAYAINDANKIGLTYQEGYRPGGSGVRLDTGAQYSYETENAKNLELSWRGQLMGGRLRVGANVFYQDWDNQQVEIYQVAGDATSSTIENAGESSSYGGELEVNYQASDMLTVYGGVGLLSTEFDDFSVNGLNLAGESFSNAPESSVVLGLQWGRETGWFAGGNIKFVSSSLSRVEAGGARQELDSFATVDAQVGYAWDDGLKVALYATNLFDERYFTYDAAPGSTQSALGERREIGFQISKTF